MALLDAATAMMAGARQPPWFGAARMVLIPKARGAVRVGPREVAAAPADLRPLSLSNTDNKLIAPFANAALRMAAAQCCSPAHFGFVAERQLGDAVLIPEASALHGVRRSSSGGLIFVDFLAAFPSVRRRWIRRVLEVMGVPGQARRLVESLYLDTFALVAVGAAEPVPIRVLSGIRQGCPASGCIFALAIDPVLRGIMGCSPSPLNRLVAFADDLATYLHHFLGMIRRFLELLADVAGATGLQLAPAKTVIVPLWADDLVQARCAIVSQASQLGATLVADRFVHLGVEVGPGAHASRWHRALAVLLERSVIVRAAQASCSEPMVLYSGFAFSTLRFVAPFDRPPPHSLRAEAQGVARALGMPMHFWSPAPCGGICCRASGASAQVAPVSRCPDVDGRPYLRG